MNTLLKCLSLSFCTLLLTLHFNHQVFAEDSTTSNLSQWELASPNNQIKTNVKLDNGSLYYSVTYGNEAILDWSALGLDTSFGQLYNDLIFVSQEQQTIDETFDMFTGKRSQYRNYCNATIYQFKNPNDQVITISFRVYNDGVAYRYTVNHNTTFQILDEKGTFVMPSNVNSYFAMKYRNNYEGFYNQSSGYLSGDYAMPLLYKLNTGTCSLIAQAELKSTYNGRMLSANGSSTYSIKAVYERDDNNNATSTPDIPTVPKDFLSPWRVLIIGSEDMLLQTEIIEALNPPLALDSTDWIQPGTSGWSWWYGDPTNNAEVYKYYIDYCKEMNFPYMLLDAGWEEIESNDFQSLVDYANARSIGLFVWSHQKDLNTPEKLEKLHTWKQLGVKGIKVDFFDSEEQERLVTYDAIIEKTKVEQLLLNFHGSNAPSGLRRTYPHIVTAEGIRGAEFTKLTFQFNPTAKHNCTVPFTRNIVGPMDFTPINYTNTGGKYTWAQATALPIIFESGVTCIADSPWSVIVSHAAQFLKGLPSTWDETVILEGSVSEYISIARRKDDVWYLGAICNDSRTAHHNLDFLGTDTYVAEIIEDGNGHSLKQRLQDVTSSTVLDLPLREHGGVAIKFTKKKPTPSVTWEVIRKDHNFVPLGIYESVKIDNTEKGDVFLGHNDLKNIALTQAPSGNFTVTTKLYFEPNKDYQKAGIIIYKDDDNYVSTQKSYHSGYGGNCFVVTSEKNQNDFEEHGVANGGNLMNYLKIEKTGTTFKGYWSADGVNWNFLKEYTNDNLTESLRVGFFASNGTKKYFSSERDAIFSEFKINGNTIPLFFN